MSDNVIPLKRKDETNETNELESVVKPERQDIDTILAANEARERQRRRERHNKNEALLKKHKIK